MEDDARPPVSEVVMAVAFERQACLNGAQLLVTLRDITGQYSKIQEQPLYEMQEELPTDQQLLQPPSFSFRIVDASAVQGHRYWLTDPSDGSTLLQVQSDYLAVNWRKTGVSGAYPGFEALLNQFFSILERVQESVLASGGTRIKVRQLELSYVNLIRPDDLWQNHSDIGVILNLESPLLQDVEQLNIVYTKPLKSPDGNFLGRLNSGIQTAYVAKQDDLPIKSVVYSDLIPVLNITNSVRSVRFEEPQRSALSRFFERAHEETDKAFKFLTTDVAREYWGIK